MKKIFCLFLVLLFTSTMVLPAYAIQNNHINHAQSLASMYSTNDRLRDARLGIIDDTIDSRILDNITLSFNFDSSISYQSRRNNDTVIPTYALRNLGNVYNNGEIVGTVYALTATEKTSSNSATQSGVDAWISIVWIDNLGRNNELVSVTGGWVPNGHALTDRYVSYTIAQSSGDTGYSIGSHPSGNSFNISVGSSGYSFSATSKVCVDGALSRLTVSVASSIWD